MKTIKATKTSLYKLMSRYIGLPKARDTQFRKTFRARTYWLEWWMDGYHYAAYFTVSAGRAMLAIESRIGDEPWSRHITSRTVYHPTLKELEELGMIEEI